MADDLLTCDRLGCVHGPDLHHSALPPTHCVVEGCECSEWIDPERTMDELQKNEDAWINLTDVIKRTRENFEGRDHRVATLTLTDTEVTIGEACDDWFVIGLNATEVGRLIDWLQRAKRRLPSDEGAPDC